MVSWTKYVTLDAYDIEYKPSYLQSFAHIPPLTTITGTTYASTYIMAQDPGNSYANARFYLFNNKGDYQKQYMYVKGSTTHGRSFCAWRDPYDGTLMLLVSISGKGYAIPWTRGTVSKDTKFVRPCTGLNGDYAGAQPIQTHGEYLAFRAKGEVISLHDRADFLRGKEAPFKKVNLSTAGGSSAVSQAWAASIDRIYNFSGYTNSNPGSGSHKHELDMWDWKGKHVGDEIDVTKMYISSSSDEPEGITFSGDPGNVMLGKRVGSTSPGKRKYPIWTVTGLP